MRCLSLAQTWRACGGEALFVMAESLPFVTDRIRTDGFAIEVAAARTGSDEDAESILRVLSPGALDWVALDGYHFTDDFYKTLQRAASSRLILDDVGSPLTRYANIVLNQNLHATSSLYPEMPSSTRMLLGTKYVLLRKEFRNTCRPEKQVSDGATKVLVSVGGGSAPDILRTILEVLQSFPLELDVAVIGPEITLAAPRRGRIRFAAPSSDMQQLMAWADLAISAAGSTCWELCCTGLPSIVIDLAPNQLPVARELAKRQAALHVSGARLEQLAGAITSLVTDSQLRAQISERASRLVDGKGNIRVVAAMRAENMRFRPASLDDAKLLWTWANDPAVRTASFSTQHIALEEHSRWLRNKLSEPGSLIFIVEEGHHAVATFRAAKKNASVAEVSVTLAPEIRGQGLASELISRGTTAVLGWGVDQVHALIRTENQVSRRSFENAGFQFGSETIINGVPAALYIAGRSEAHRMTPRVAALVEQ